MATFTLDGYNSYSGCDIVVTASLPLINGQSVGKYYTLGSLQTLSISTHQDKRPVRSLGVINAKDYVMGPRTIAGSMVFAVFNRHFATEIMKDLGTVLLPDEIPALDITVSFANEYGKQSRMAIYGVKLINEGQVMSINDLYTENTYQFVALGLEPLNTETDAALHNSNDGTNTGESVITSESYYDDGQNLNDFESNSGANVSDKIKNNSALDTDKTLDNNVIIEGNETIELQVSVQHAYNTEDLGIATFTILPSQKSGQINVYIGPDKKEEPDYILAVTDANDAFSVSLARDKYTAQYIDSQSAKYSNIVNFIVDVEDTTETQPERIDIVPFIEKVTDKTITVSLESREFDTIHYFKKGGAVSVKAFEKGSIILSGLEPNTEYWIYFSNSVENSLNALNAKKSTPVSVKTFNKDQTEGGYFRVYVEDNSELLVNDKDEVLNVIDELEGNPTPSEDDSNTPKQDTDEIEEILDKIKFPNKFVETRTLIEAVLTLPESSIKQELLIFANKLTYQLISSYNSYNDCHITEHINDHPFSAQISLKNFDKANVYEYANNKSYLVKPFDCLTDSFYGKPGKQYSIYGINLKTGERSVPRFFSVCRSTYMNNLNAYTNTNCHEQLDLNSNLIRYNKYDNTTVLDLTIKEHCYCDLNVLPPPYVYIADNGTVIANVKYDFINTNRAYHLVCAELYEALDYTPFRKVKFDGYTHEINLNDQYIGLLPGNKYLFWVEDDAYLKLSKPFLFEYTLKEDTPLKEIYNADVDKRLSKLKKELLNIYPGNFMLEELFQYVHDCKLSEKDLYSILESELITYCENSKYEIMTYEILFELMKLTQTSNKMKILPDIVIDKNSRNIQFEKINGYYMCGINYTEDGSTRTYCWNNILNYGDKGYMLIFLMSDLMLYKSGFVLIDCKNNRYMTTEDLVEYISEGVIG